MAKVRNERFSGIEHDYVMIVRTIALWFLVSKPKIHQVGLNYIYLISQAIYKSDKHYINAFCLCVLQLTVLLEQTLREGKGKVPLA